MNLNVFTHKCFEKCSTVSVPVIMMLNIALIVDVSLYKVLQERDVCFGYYRRVTLFNINHFLSPCLFQFRDIGVNTHFWPWGLIRPRTLIRLYRNNETSDKKIKYQFEYPR